MNEFATPNNVLDARVPMRIELTEARHCPALRDYFLRLGAEVVQTDEEAIDVHFAEGILQEDESAEMYLQTWARYNRVDARSRQPSPRSGRLRRPRPQPNRLIPPGSTPPARRVASEQGPGKRRATLARARRKPTGRRNARARPRPTGLRIRVRTCPRSRRAVVDPLRESRLDRRGPFVLGLLPRDVGIRNAAVPVRFVRDELRVAFADPSDTEAVAAVQGHVSVPIQPAIAELSDIDAVWRSVAS